MSFHKIFIFPIAFDKLHYRLQMANNDVRYLDESWCSVLIANSDSDNNNL